jgi:hypothetical protein
MHAALIICQYDNDVGLCLVRRSGNGEKVEHPTHDGDANDKGTPAWIETKTQLH